MIAMFIRVILGPSLADRIVALDAIGLQLMACIALTVFYGGRVFISSNFTRCHTCILGTAVFSKFIDKGKVIDRDNDDHQ